MTIRSHLPFARLKGGAWLNLALASLVAFYVMYLIVEALLRTTCGQLGIDYCDYISAGNIASRFGYSKIYDLVLLDRVQKTLLPAQADPASIPVDIFPYLPVFVLPFQALAAFSPAAGFWTWTGLKVVALVVYLQFFARRLGLQRRGTLLTRTTG